MRVTVTQINKPDTSVKPVVAQEPPAIQVRTKPHEGPRTIHVANPMKHLGGRQSSLETKVQSVPREVTRDMYDEAKRENAADLARLNAQRSYSRDLLTQCDTRKAERAIKKNNERFSKNEITQKELAGLNNKERQKLLHASDAKAAHELLQPTITELEDTERHSREHVQRLAKALRAQHIETMRANLPMEDIHEFLTWALHAGRSQPDSALDVYKLLGYHPRAPENKDVQERISNSLDL